MSVKFSHVLGVAVVASAIVALLRVIPATFERTSAADAVASSEPASPASSPYVSSPVAGTAAQAAPLSNAPTVAVLTPQPGVPAASVPATIRTTTPIHFDVAAPAVTSALDPFDAVVRISAPDGFHRLRFAVSYDRRTLELTGVSEGDFAQQRGATADFVVDEPSDGNVEVTFTLRDGRATPGTGSVAVLHFEPRKSNRVRIAVANVSAVDSTGTVRFHSASPSSVIVDVE
jgi:hypothetical protein